MDSHAVSQLAMKTDSKIVMLVMDGLGGLPKTPDGKTELETAFTPNLDSLAAKSSLGSSTPVRTGVTTGSGPGHLGLFGYDPIEYEIGRGALEALGVDFDLYPQDVAARGNFCTIDEDGSITDRRAGRIPTETAEELIGLLSAITIDGYQIFLLPIKEHRFAFILRGNGLDDRVEGTDPLVVGEKPLQPRAMEPGSELTAKIFSEFIEKAKPLLSRHKPANMILLRGFARLPKIPTFQELYKLNPAAIAVNGMYRGVARLAGMKVLDVGGKTIADEFRTLSRNWKDHDFFYIHIKQTDTFGEMGNFEEKVKIIEEVDAWIPGIMSLNPDVVIVTGDHSSPAVMKAHSWHPVPTLFYSKYVRADQISAFGEQSCLKGSLGMISSTDLMPLAMANALKLNKYGA